MKMLDPRTVTATGPGGSVVSATCSTLFSLQGVEEGRHMGEREKGCEAHSGGGGETWGEERKGVRPPVEDAPSLPPATARVEKEAGRRQAKASKRHKSLDACLSGFAALETDPPLPSSGTPLRPAARTLRSRSLTSTLPPVCGRQAGERQCVCVGTAGGSVGGGH